MKSNKFYIKFSENYFNKNDIIETSNNIKLKVLETPYKKLYKQLLQFITFGLYKLLHNIKLK